MASSIGIGGRLVSAIFYKRLNRFLALVQVDTDIVPSFLPNPGRMHELLTPRTKVILREALPETRKTRYDLIGVFHKGQLISVDSRVPNKLVLEALRNGDILELSGYHRIKPEFSYGRTRFDFFLADGRLPCLLEVKSCTLVKHGVAMFPDAETVRGRRHLMDLVIAKGEGYRACMLFLVQRTDARVFTANDVTDPKFGQALRYAAKEGVEVYAYSSEFKKDRITLKDRVKVHLEFHRKSG